MNIGTLRHRIQIQNKSDGTGGSVGASGSCASTDPFVDGAVPWTTFYTCFSSLKALTSKEVAEFNQVNMKVSHKIIIRYPGRGVAISAGNQVLYRNRVFELQTGLVNVDERDRELDLLAFEINPIL